MKAITVRQPWAWAIIHAGKDVENRTRNIVGDYRGPLAIHSSGRKSDDAQRIPADVGVKSDLFAELGGWDRLLFGCVLGVVDLVDVHRAEQRCCSVWADAVAADGGSLVQHLVLANPRPLRLPLQIPGHLGLWELPDHLLNGRW